MESTTVEEVKTFMQWRCYECKYVFQKFLKQMSVVYPGIAPCKDDLTSKPETNAMSFLHFVFVGMAKHHPGRDEDDLTFKAGRFVSEAFQQPVQSWVVGGERAGGRRRDTTIAELLRKGRLQLEGHTLRGCAISVYEGGEEKLKVDDAFDDSDAPAYESGSHSDQ